MISIEQRIVAGTLAALVAAVIVPPALQAGVAAGVAALAGALALQWPLVHLVPASFAGARRRRPIVCALWLLLAVVALAQTTRLSAFMTDISRTWGSTIPDPVVINHQCLGAYVHAADLVRRQVANPYDAGWYPAYAGACGLPSTSVGVRGLGRWVVDPYLYPPPFLLVPHLALALTNSFDAIRTAWFVCQSLLFLAGAIALSRWLDEPARGIWLLLIPAVLASPPAMLNLQFGQFHAVAMLMAVAGMVLFDRQQPAAGGALLAFAVLSKISPGILLVVLAAQRRWRDLGWTAAGLAGWTLLGIGILGVTPFTTFVGYEVPRLISGEAFSFVDLPSQSAFVTSRNFAIAGIGARLRLLGLAEPTPGQLTLLAWAFSLFVVWLATRLRRDVPRLSQAIGWLALLDLAALRASAAPSAYVVVPALWMLALLAGEVRGRARWAAMVALAWVVIVGTPPLPTRIDLVVAGLGQVMLVGTSVWAILRRADYETRTLTFSASTLVDESRNSRPNAPGTAASETPWVART